MSEFFEAADLKLKKFLDEELLTHENILTSSFLRLITETIAK